MSSVLQKTSLVDRRVMLARLARDIARKPSALTALEVDRLKSLNEEIAFLETDIEFDQRRKHDHVFGRWLKYGTRGLTSEEAKTFREFRDESTMGKGSGLATGGGIFVGAGFQSKITEALRDYSSIFRLATVVDSDRGNAMPWPAVNDTNIAGELLLENQQSSQVDVGWPTQSILGAYKFGSHVVKASREFIEDNGVDFEGWLIRQFMIRVERAAAPYFHSGTGVGQPQGFITVGQSAGIAVGSESNDHGVGGSFPIGTDDIATLEGALDVQYRKNGTFLVHPDTLAIMRKVKNSIGSPVFPDLHGGQTDAQNRVFNYPLSFSPFVSSVQKFASSPAATTIPIVFADFSKFVIRRVRPTIIRMEERYAEFGAVAFVLFWRMDSQLIDGDGGASCQYLEVVY